jgi:hypothetical protein
VIFSQSRQVNFWRTYCATFHCRRTTSNVSVTSSPSLASGDYDYEVGGVEPVRKARAMQLRQNIRCRVQPIRRAPVEQVGILLLGPSRHFAVSHKFGRFRGKPDIEW